jgi:stearoyl-CoA desaturase (Delta-9 desaturase)
VTLIYLFQGSIYDWVRLHRFHHQTFRTSDDPFYSNKDFFHAQILSQITKLSLRQEQLLKQIDMADIEKDKIVMFQKRYTY